MKRGIAVVATLVAACSPEQPRSEAPTNVTAPEPVASPAQAGGGLHAEVSGLSADVSGLNVRVTDMATIVDLPTDTLFAFDSATLGPAAAANLGKAADRIRKGAPGAVQIVGHTDSKGEDAYNQALSERRAQAVADWMKQQVGVRQRDFAVSGKGETAPLVPNARPDGSDDPDGRAKNRRVEIVIPR